MTLAQRIDGWKNVLTGLGDIARDRAYGHAVFSSQPTLVSELNALYHDDPIAWKIAQKLPRDALRQGFDVLTTSDIDPEITSAQRELIENELSRLGFLNKLKEAAVWARVYGLGALYLVLDDNQDPAQPAQEGASVLSIIVLEPSSHQLQPVAFYSETSGPNATRFGQPMIYQAQRTGSSALVNIHESRLLTIGGEQTSATQREQNNYRDYPILHWAIDAIRAYDSALKSVSNMITDASQGVLKIKGFHEMIASSITTAIQTRLEMIDLGKFVGRVLPLDADGEDFTYQDRSLSGVSDQILHLEYQVALAADMPATVLFGRSPAGMNATGDSDTRVWYDAVSSAQTDLYGPVVDEMLMIIARYTGATDPTTWYCAWPSLWQMSPNEESAYRNQIAQTDEIYLRNSVVTPDEIAQARFGSPGEYSDQSPTIDAEGRMNNQRSSESQIEALERIMNAKVSTPVIENETPPDDNPAQ